MVIVLQKAFYPLISVTRMILFIMMNTLFFLTREKMLLVYFGATVFRIIRAVTFGILVYHTELNTLGDFSCSDEKVNKLQKITRRSILSNFYHFPTDCPQREKNGWTRYYSQSSKAKYQ